MSRTGDDWSDSDDEQLSLSQVETSVFLGVPDGPITDQGDLSDVAVSRLGGLPAFLTSSEPAFSSSICKVCRVPMELLLQIWCPLEDSPMDRALYIWGCARTGCQTQDGSIRAWRGLRYNQKYAAKLEQKAQQKKASSKVAPATTTTGNPFSMTKPMPASSFGIGSQIFQQPSSPSVASHPSATHTEAGDESDSESVSSSSSQNSLVTALATTTLDDSPWKKAPRYSPIYLNSHAEYLPADPNYKVQEDLSTETDEKDSTWTSEVYENSIKTDAIFDRFLKRVTAEAEQCLRYDFGGTPLPFASDDIFDKIFTVPPGVPEWDPRHGYLSPTKRIYEPSKLPPCPDCESGRVFECQLTPNLINIFRPTPEKIREETLDKRMKRIENDLKGRGKPSGRGLDWGTVMIFSCEKDCRGDHDKEAWKEEYVLIQRDL